MVFFWKLIINPLGVNLGHLLSAPGLIVSSLAIVFVSLATPVPDDEIRQNSVTP